jgi:hypothetical protein
VFHQWPPVPSTRGESRGGPCGFEELRRERLALERNLDKVDRRKHVIAVPTVVKRIFQDVACFLFGRF